VEEWYIATRQSVSEYDMKATNSGWRGIQKYGQDYNQSMDNGDQDKYDSQYNYLVEDHGWKGSVMLVVELVIFRM
jgi:hypothetical protein